MSKHQAPLPNPIPQAGEGANETRRAARATFDEAGHTLGMAQMDDTHREFIAQLGALIAASDAR
jgi:hypothetical protein